MSARWVLQGGAPRVCEEHDLARLATAVMLKRLLLLGTNSVHTEQLGVAAAIADRGGISARVFSLASTGRDCSSSFSFSALFLILEFCCKILILIIGGRDARRVSTCHTRRERAMTNLSAPPQTLTRLRAPSERLRGIDPFAHTLRAVRPFPPYHPRKKLEP